MKLSIIIVSWNVKDELIECLKSARSFPPHCRSEVIVVDNASSDGTAEELETGFSEVKLIRNEQNMGFAAACNQGVAEAKGAYLFFLNPDTRLLPETLDKLIDLMEQNPDIGIAGPKLLYPDGSIQPSVRRFPSMRGVLYRYTALKYLGLFKSHFNYWMAKDFDYNQQGEVGQLMGAALMVRSSVFESVQGFDERFFMYYEEVDLCYRIKKENYSVTYFPSSQIVHSGGKSAEQIQAKVLYMKLESMLRFFRKHQSQSQIKVFSLVFKVDVLTRIAAELLIHSIKYLLNVLTGNSQRRKRSLEKIKTDLEFVKKYYLSLLRC